MAFPEDVLGNKVEIYYDGEWHDITTNGGDSVVRGVGAQDGEINIEMRGEPDENTALQPTIARLSLNNRDGRFSPRNASSDLYGLIGTNTPLRISTDLADSSTVEDEFSGTRTDTWGVTDVSGHTWNNTGGNASDYDVGSGTGIHTHQANSVVKFSQILNTVGGDPLQATDVDIYMLGCRVGATPITGAAMEMGIRARLAVFEPDYVEGRIFFTTSNTVTCNVRYVMGYAEIASTAFTAVSGATNASSISFRFQAQGGTLRLKAWVGTTLASEPSAWTLELATTHIAPGYFTIYSLANGGNTNVKPIATIYSAIKAYLGVVLFTGEVVEWPKKWDSTGSDVWTPIVATGITRRLRQGNRPIRSPLYRFYTRDLADLSLGTVVTSIQHYWSMEGLAQQTRFIRDEIGDIVMRFDVATHNTVEWGSNDFLVGSGKLVTITGLPIPEGVVIVPFISTFDTPFGTVLPTPVTPAEADTFTFSCWFYWPPLLDSFPFLPATSLYFSFAVPGSTMANIFVDIQYRPDSNTFAGVLDSTSGDLADTGSLPFTDQPHLLLVDWYVDGADLWTCDVYLDNSVILSDSASFRPFAHVTDFDIETEPYSPVTIGHLTFETGTLFTRTLSFRNDVYQAGQGFPGETAVERFERLCETEGVEYEVFSTQEDIDFPTLMGPQRVGNFIDHLDDISRADGGVIYELRTPFGYGFRTRAYLYGVPSTGYPLTLDYSNADLGEVPAVTGDDQRTRNVIRAKLRGGTQGELSYVVTDGPLGTDAVGEYEDGGIEVALNATDQLDDFVFWLAYLGTWDEDRWPELVLHLHRAPFVADIGKFLDALLLEIGQLILVNNPPTWVSPDGVIQQLRGVAVLLSNFNLSLTYTLLPGGPFASLGTLNNTDADRADIDSCYLVSAVDSDDTDLIVTTYLTETPFDTPLWTRDPAEMNSWGHQGMSLRINPASREGGLGGERVEMGVTAPVRDTFTRSASQLSGSVSDSGHTWAQTQGTATDVTVNGTSAVALHTAANTNVWVELPVGDWDHALNVSVTYNFTTCTGAQFITDYMVRQTDGNNNYVLRLVMEAASAVVTMQLRKAVGGVGSQILSNVTVGTNVAGTPINVRLSIVGRDILGKAWISTAEEPEWQVFGYDAAADVINGTNIGLRSIRLTGNTNVNASSTWDNLTVHTPKIRPVVWDRFAYTVLNNPDGAFPDDQTYPTVYNWFTAGLVEADLDFTPNQLQITGSVVNAYGAVYLDQINYLDGVCEVTWTCPVVTGTDGLEPGNIMMRGTTITEYILFRNFVTADNQIFVQIYSRTGVFLGQAYVPPDAHRVDRPMRTKAGCFGDQLMIKTWDASMPEPVTWQLVVTDPDPQSGWVGLRAGRRTGNTNTNAAMTFHEFRMDNPQRLTVVRGANGVSRGWDAGSAVSLWSPMRLGR